MVLTKGPAALAVLGVFLTLALAGCIGDSAGADKSKGSSSPSGTPTGTAAKSGGGPGSTSTPRPTPTTGHAGTGGNGTGNQTSSGNGTAGAGPGTVKVFSGSFPANTASSAVASFTVNLTAGVKEIQAYLQYHTNPAILNSPVVGDLDLKLTNPAGTDVVSQATSDYEYIHFNDTSKLTPGSWKLTVVPTQVVAPTAFTLNVTVFNLKPTVTVFTGSSGPAATTLDDPVSNLVLIPTAAHFVTARLGWIDALTPTAPAAAQQPFCGKVVRYALADYDLTIVKGSTAVAASANGQACEWTQVVGKYGAAVGDGTKWDFQVQPYTVVETNWQLTVEYA